MGFFDLVVFGLGFDLVLVVEPEDNTVDVVITEVFVVEISVDEVDIVD